MLRLLHSLISHFCNDDSDDESSIVLKKRPLLQPPKPDQLKSHTPLIIRYFFSTYLRLYVIDGHKEKECRLRTTPSLKTADFFSICGGLVLLSFTTDDYVVFDPLKNETIATIDGPDLRKSQPCGFFFHPSEKDYRILAVLPSNEAGYKYEYQIYSLGENKWRRIRNPNFNFRPICWWKFHEANGVPAVTNGALHWYHEGKIMVFDMISEELSMKRLPFVDYLMKLYYFNAYLVTKGRELCLCVVGRIEPAMDVWVLQDYDKWRWARRYIVDLNWDLMEYPVTEPWLTAFCIVRVVGFEGDRVVLFWRHRGLFVYDLGLRSVERIWMRKLKVPREAYYDSYCGFALLQPTHPFLSPL